MMWGRIVHHRANQLLPFISTSITTLWNNDLLFGPYGRFVVNTSWVPNFDLGSIGTYPSIVYSLSSPRISLWL